MVLRIIHTYYTTLYIHIYVYIYFCHSGYIIFNIIFPQAICLEYLSSVYIHFILYNIYVDVNILYIVSMKTEQQNKRKMRKWKKKRTHKKLIKPRVPLQKIKELELSKS